MSSPTDDNPNNDNDGPNPRPVPPLNGDRGRRLKITPALDNCGVVQLYKEGIRMQLQLHSKNDTIVIFNLHKDGLLATLQEFEKVANRKHIDLLTIQAIMTELSTNPYYIQALQYNEVDDASVREGIGIPSTNTGDFFIDDNTSNQERKREQDPNAADVAEQEYNDEGLSLLTIDDTLKLDKSQRVRIIGQIQKTKYMFDLIKQISVTCDNQKCKHTNKFRDKKFNLKSGLYSMGDFPYVYPGGPVEAENFLKCQFCKKFMIVTPTQNRFQNARMIELEHVDIEGDRITAALNSTSSGMKHIDTLEVRISGIHTQKIRQGEQVEMIGELLIVPSSVNSATRQTMQSGIRRRNNNDEIIYAENMGKYKKLFYADKIKYISRAKQINYDPERDTKAIRKFATIASCPKCKMASDTGIKIAVKDSKGKDVFEEIKDKDGNITKVRKLQEYEDLIPRLVSMFAPLVAGEDLAKEALLLQAVGPAPIVSEAWIDRKNVNVGLFGDVGTAKSLLGHEATKLLPGSREVTAIHSTAKSIIAVAVKDNDGPWYTHLGPAILADKATLFLDEIAAMRNWEDQNEFLQLMNTNQCPFNKADIDQMLYAETNFILAANPTSLNWRHPTEITKDDMNVKLTVLDRLDMIVLFRDRVANKPDIAGIERNQQYKQKVKDWAYEMVETLKKRYNLDYNLLRKFIYYVKTSDQLKTLQFENKDLIYDLSDTWAEIKSKYPHLIGNRGIKSVFRIASCYARLMLKPTIDKEVVDRTTWFLSEMYKRFGAEIENPDTKNITITNERDRVFYKIALAIKNIAVGKEYFMSSDDAADITEIPFKDLTQSISDRDPEVAGYLRIRSDNKKKIGHNNRVERLREEFLEKCGKDGYEFEGGRLQIVNDTAPRGLILKWVENPHDNKQQEQEPTK